MKSFILFLINLYRKSVVFHPLFQTIFLTGSICRFCPTCSEYMEEAVIKHGAVKGLGLGIRRILRCHPWSKGGFDPVPKKL